MKIIFLALYLINFSYADETSKDYLPEKYKEASDIISKQSVDGRAKKHHWWQFLDAAALTGKRDVQGSLPVTSRAAGQEQNAKQVQFLPASTNSSTNISPMSVSSQKKPVDLTEGLPPVDHPFTFAADIQKAIFDAVAAYVPGFSALPEEQKSIVAQVNMMAAIATQGKK